MGKRRVKEDELYVYYLTLLQKEYIHVLLIPQKTHRLTWNIDTKTNKFLEALYCESKLGFTRCIGQDSDRDIEINGRILNGGNNTENWLLNIGKAKGIFF